MIEASLNIVIIMALLFCIVGGLYLDRRLRNFSTQRQELATLVAQLETTMRIAEKHLQRVDQLMIETDAALQPKISQALKLQDELDYMIARGDAVAQQLFGAMNQPPPQSSVSLATGTDGAMSWPNDLRHSLKNLR
jgi:hypothetical protein